MAATTRTDYACSVCTKTFGDHSRCAKHVNGRGTCKAKGAIVQPITVHFSINDRNVGGRLGQQRGGLGYDVAARQSSDRDLDMEGADGEPESGPACLSGILTYPNKSSILVHTYPYLSILIHIYLV